jgi:hypothetical protein
MCTKISMVQWTGASADTAPSVQEKVFDFWFVFLLANSKRQP